MSQAVLQQHADAAGLRVAIVWIDMLPTDNLAAAEQASRQFPGHDDPRVRQFHIEQEGSVLFPAALGKKPQPVFDVYFFYEPGPLWQEKPPPPIAWMHQLVHPDADPARYFHGANLQRELSAATARLLQPKQ